MKAAVPLERLTAMWTTLVSQAGGLKGCSDARAVRGVSDKQMVITACEFERATFDLQIAFDPAAGSRAWCFAPPRRVPAKPYTPAPRTRTRPPTPKRTSRRHPASGRCRGR